jgi:hypothetical protein
MAVDIVNNEPLIEIDGLAEAYYGLRNWSLNDYCD